MLVLLIVVCYLIGSIPVAWLLARLVTGRDIRELGTGNVGVMNTALSVARWAGLLVFLAEAAKGVAAVLLARYLDGSMLSVGLAALAAIVGTRWSIWMRGAGGRGNTSAMTALLLISWRSLLILGAIWLLARLIARNSFIAMRVTLATIPIVLGLVTWSWPAAILGAAFSLLFLSTHRTETDDHLLMKEQWSGLRSFLTMPRRK
jgi:glycerol-3-phosphate acyltransferase PlsY